MPIELACSTGSRKCLDHRNWNPFARFSSNGATAGGWAPRFLGLDRRSLLRDVLGAVGRHRGCQRFVAEVSAVLEHAAGG